MTDLDIGMVVPVMNNFKGLTELMSSVDEKVLPLVIDNWSTNYGVAAAWNQGLKRSAEAGCAYTLLINDDAWLLPGTLKKLVASLDRFMIVSPLNIEEYPEWPPGEYGIDLNFAAVMFRTGEFINTVGYFDENFWPAYYEDIDMQHRLMCACPTRRGETRLDAHFVHLGSVTNSSVPPWGRNGNGVRSLQDRVRQRNYYIEKWGGDPGDEIYDHPYNDPTMTIKDWRKT